MNNADNQYIGLVNKVLTEGKWKSNRTGEDCLTIAGAMFEHDMSEGFPLLTTRSLPFKSTKVELEFFIKGLTSKKWLEERGCGFWRGWASPKKVPYANDEETKVKMAAEDDLGPIYGYQFRFFNKKYKPIPEIKTGFSKEIFEGVDQLKNIVDLLKKDPNSRRAVCTAWNPLMLAEMSLVPCHTQFQVTVIDGRLNLAWYQRSIDIACNQTITTYALLLHLLAKEAGLKEGKLIGFFMDAHIYRSHVPNLKIQIAREPRELPTIETPNFTSIFDWTYEDTNLLNYNPHDKLSYKVAI